MNRRFDELSKKLEKNGFKVKIFNNSDEVKDFLLNEIKVEDTVGIGGSMTISNLGIYEELKSRGNKVYWHWKAVDKKSELEKAINTKIYLSSTNAITMDGKLINIDGTGNRVASMIFGHDEVYIVTGINKICKDYDEAIERINTVACPKNAERLKLDTPCRYTGRCNDCDSPGRMCGAEVILHRRPKGTSINILLVDEEMGY